MAEPRTTSADMRRDSMLTPTSLPSETTPALPPPGEEHVGWSAAKPDVMPRATYWPVVMAAGITLFLMGLVTSLVLSGVGLVIIARALAGWIVEIRHEGLEHE